ncbi:armadillo-type protein [Piptocephalis cylindrospora]|uniref:Nucleolar protein 9 n=1 Tax=Piptocephalis cylindrospora TaxID=1907219 RepID=A0A4P9Y4A6_9FUNG|nr:armadillo-type protein [Piptocephalis cylindrospora]|eukprot:RKP13745.1 armadillo-type protein [Piptocephalis cylindrospora]
MPREQRRGRRGKKQRKEAAKAEEREEQYPAAAKVDSATQPEHHPSEYGDEGLVQIFYGRMDADMQGYLKKAEALLDETGIEDAEEQEAFIANVFAEVRGKERLLATDHECSRILEKLLRISPPSCVLGILEAFSGHLHPLAMHRFASHVVQTAIITTGRLAYLMNHNGGDAQVKVEGVDASSPFTSAESAIGEVCKELTPQWIAMINDRFASHVLRTLLCILGAADPSGSPGESQGTSGAMRSKRSQKYNESVNNAFSVGHKQGARSCSYLRGSIPPSFPDLLDAGLDRITLGLSQVEIRAFALSPVANPVLQLILGLKPRGSFEDGEDSFLNKLLMGFIVPPETESPQDKLSRDAFMDTLIKDTTGSHLFEAICLSSSDALYANIYTTYFRSKLSRLSFHPVANFVVQKLLANVRNGPQFELMLEELLPEFNHFLIGNKTGVLRSIVDACTIIGDSYKMVIQGLCDAFGLRTSDERLHFVDCILHMLSYPSLLEVKAAKEEEEEEVVGGKPKIRTNVQGALLLQSLVKFPQDHNAIVISSFLAEPAQIRVAWCKDPTASRVVESILESRTVGLKAKRLILTGFLDHYHELAMDKFGGHVVDKCWAMADLEMKSKIAEQLAFHRMALQNSFHGKFILRNCRIEQYIMKKGAWEEIQKGAERKRAMFEDILEGDNSPSQRAKEARVDKEIDQIFQGASTKNGKGIALAPLAAEVKKEEDKKLKKKKRSKSETEVDSVLEAIAATGKGGSAGKDTSSKRKVKKERDEEGRKKAKKQRKFES